MKKRDLLALSDLSAVELHGLLALAAHLKAERAARKPHPLLAGRTLAMIFAKASTRTRVSFEVGMHQLGGHAVMLGTNDTQISRGEPIPDTAGVLSRYVDAIMIRTFAHADVEMLAQHADVPVINGLTDKTHPCQVLADLLTCREAFGADALSTMRVAWVGDGNNMACSWLNAAAVLGFEVTLACPPAYQPDAALAAAQAAGVRVSVCATPAEAARGAHVVTTDTWASMGQEAETAVRKQAFAGFGVDAAVMAEAHRDAIFLHCLPAYRGLEVTADVIDGPQSRIFDEAENRLHVQKAVMAWVMGGAELPDGAGR
ncbi:MAG: ornithine carbamoyltransferase [Myxococcales bacterium]|nr:ornithine carbamoyltransferase [Myxococcales bacterium]